MAKKTSKFTALTPGQLAKVLSSAGSRKITEAMVSSDITGGAPTNSDGSINLIHYTAWLVQEISSGD